MKRSLSRAGLSGFAALALVGVFASNAVAATMNMLPQSSFQMFVVNMLDNSFVAALLLTLGLAGILIELFVTGFGLAGIVGIAAFALYFLGNIWAGNVSTAVLLLFLVGLLMLAAEIFVTPGGGALGILGIAAILFSVFWAAPSVSYAVTAVLISLVAAGILVAVSIKFGKTRKVWNRLILGLKQDNNEGYVAPDAHLAELLGAKGIAVTILRPAGTAEIAGRRIDVVTEGDFIDTGSDIEVIGVEGLRVVVRKCADSE